MAKKKIAAQKEEPKKMDTSGYFIPAFLFIGMGFGFLFDQLVPGIMLGLGVGFLFALISRYKKK